ncbi:hypothetical protein GLYMA_13G198850v4 [Glycine max]|nr:hypothetical protein GYH30_036777 [Glycine max]KRH20675.2 hypothetical protein GLYMA_13G198850v4 [Glycine max]
MLASGLQLYLFMVATVRFLRPNALCFKGKFSSYYQMLRATVKTNCFLLGFDLG